MLCPKCDYKNFEIGVPCAQCEFRGDVDLLLRLSHLDFLLDEFGSWPPLIEKGLLEGRYERQLREVEVDLGLREPPPSVEEAVALREQLSDLVVLREALKGWVREGWLLPSVGRGLHDEVAGRREALERRLVDAPPTPARLLPLSLLEQIAQKRFLIESLEGWYREERIIQVAFEALRAQLVPEMEALEIEAGLRQAPEPQQILDDESVSQVAEPVSAGIGGEEGEADGADAPPRAERTPWTWDRVWESLLSERTLQAILFMGVALMFAAAVSLVVYNWDTFEPAVQVAFLAGFTALFYGLGWYVRTRMDLYGSGIALSAIASLLVPLDFYAFYLSGGLPQDRWPEIWLVASLVCLIVYTIATYSIQAPFFGYLVGLAAGSLLTSTLNYVDVNRDLWQTSLVLLALGLAVGAEALHRRAKDSPWRVFATPFWRLALLSTVPLLILGLGWGFLGGVESRVFFFSLAINWWLGGLLFTLATPRYRLQMMPFAAALAFPVAMWLTQRWYFEPREIHMGWYALGWATLVPVYWLAGWSLQQRFWKSEDKLDRQNGRTVLMMGGLLVLLSAGWSLTNMNAATVVHLLLAATMLMGASLWLEPRLMWGMSLFLLSASAAWQATRGATPAELALPWALLSILHIIVALRLDRSSPRSDDFSRPSSRSDDFSRPSPLERLKSLLRGERLKSLLRPLYGASLLLAGLAILPPLILFDHSLLAYALGNWIGVNGWLAYLIHGTDAPGFRALWPRMGRPTLRHLDRLGAPQAQGTTLFQWFAALPIVPWLWLNWTNGREASASLGLAYAILAWGLLWWGVRLRRTRWEYGQPWQVAAHLSNMAAMMTGFAYYDQSWWASILLLVGVFYFAAAPVLHDSRWLVPGGLIFPVGVLVGLEWLGVPDGSLYTAAALIVLSYVAVPAILIQWRGVRATFVQPLYGVALFMALPIFVASLGATGIWWDVDHQLMWISATQIILALTFVLYTWGTGQVVWGHVALWLAIYGAGLLVKTYSKGSGRSAALAAFLAVAYVLAERGLHRLALTPAQNWAAKGWASQIPVTVVRRAWRLFRQPLLFAGWAISVGAIGAALLRNMILLGGGMTRQTWAIVALLTITGLYALSARLFRQVRFVWFASVLAIFPWTLSTKMSFDLGLWPGLESNQLAWYGPSWMMLALLGLGVGVLLANYTPSLRMGRGTWGGRAQRPSAASASSLKASVWCWPPQVVAHLLVVLLALFWSAWNVATGSVSLGLAVAFYLAAVWIDRRFQVVKRPFLGRFLYPATALVPLWAVYVLYYFVPDAAHTTAGLLVLAFALPALFVGRRLEEWERTGRSAEVLFPLGAQSSPVDHPFSSRPYSLPLYLTAYGSAIVATLVVADERPFLIGVLFFNTGLTILSAYLFRQPLWLYSAAATLPWAIVLSLIEANVPATRHGWALIGLGAAYLIGARVLRMPGWASRFASGSATARVAPYGTPLMVAAFILLTFGLVPSSQDRLGAMVGYGLAGIVYLGTALWLRQPLLANAAAGLAIVPYWVGMLELGVPSDNYGLALWPGILVSLLLARRLHESWLAGDPVKQAGAYGEDKTYGEGGTHAPKPGPTYFASTTHDDKGFPWHDISAWPGAIIGGLLNWWAFPLYALGFGGLVVSALLSLESKLQLWVVLLLGSLVYVWAIYRFKRRGWLLLASVWTQLTALAVIRWFGWTETPAQIALAFTPVTVLTATIALLIEKVFNEELPLLWGEKAMLRFSLAGWSRPLYGLLAVDLIVVQLATFAAPSSGLVTLTHALILSVLATVWTLSAVGYVPVVLGVVALMQRLHWNEANFTDWPVAIAWLTLLYGAIGYGLLFWQRQRPNLPPRALIWEEPLRKGGLLMSVLALILPLQLLPLVVGMMIRAIFNQPLIQAEEMAQVQMVISVFAITGLLYLTAALVERKRDWAYGALLLLLSSWSVWLLLIQEQRELQLYALPAGIYLLALGWIEWHYGSRRFAAWVDRLGLLLLFGSLFWQSFGENGGAYALLMIFEGLLIAWLGSTRRQRRLLYAGVTAVISAVISQLIDPLFQLDTFVLWLLGAALLALAIALERRLEEVRTLSKEWRLRLEHWD
ncbi:MAG: hypothetical protein ACPGWR_13530 [Ardenticatenaceae bacterium]